MNAEQFAKFLEVQQKILEKMTSNATISTGAGSSNQLGLNTNIALVPNFELLDISNESFRNYKLRFENYTRMKNIDNNKEYCASLLLNSIGAKSFNTVTALASPKTPSELKYDELVKLLEEHLSPKQNVLVSQHQFLSKYQTDQQSISEFVAELRTDIGDCEFYCQCKKSVAEIFLRAQFIRGLKDNNIRETITAVVATICVFRHCVKGVGSRSGEN